MDSEFRTIVAPLKCKGFLLHSAPIMLIGSCFSDEIGLRLRKSLFDVMTNPLGTLYNPLSILQAIEQFIDLRHIDSAELVSDGRMYHYFGAHSSMSSVDADAAVERINSAIDTAHDFLAKASAVIITLGTSWVFSRKDTGAVVANCHKFPASYFTLQCLSAQAAMKSIDDIVDRLRRFNPNIRIIFTISPIRHKANGMHGNQRSKSTLQVAVGDVCSADESVGYFHSYEIMLDDLRDYRFYAADMVHPSDVAVDYIFSNFLDSYFTDEDIAAIHKADRLAKRLAHRQLTDDLESLERFRQSTAEYARQLSRQYPYLKDRINLDFPT